MKKPILAIRCSECGGVYFACALAYGVDEDASKEIADAVARGDEIFITEKVKFDCCDCDSNDNEDY